MKERSLPVNICRSVIACFPPLLVTILMEVKWNLTVVLICITLMANVVEHFFISIIIHLYVSFTETSFQRLFKNWAFCLLVIEFRNF